MCAFCALMTGTTHWTEAGSDVARTGDSPTGRDRFLGRIHRTKLVNRVLAHYGCSVSDWANSSYIVRGQRGQATIVDNLPQVWMAAEQIAKKVADPLDPALLAALRQLPAPARD